MKFIPYSKLQKKKQKEVNKRKRRNFGQLKPVTRVAKNSKAYDRKSRAEDTVGQYSNAEVEK